MTSTNIISFDDWKKLDLRVGKILNVEDIDGADKLYRLEVDIGDEKRTVCAGLKKYYSKDELVGKKVVLFVNLAPRTLKGIESRGMVLASVDEKKDEVFLISPEKDSEVGSRVS